MGEEGQGIRTTRRRWLTGAVALVMGATACGSSASSKQAATEASDGCHQMLGVGQAVVRQQPSSGSALDTQLRHATADLNSAAHLDHQWSTLARAASGFVTTLEAGRTPSEALVVQVTNGCQQFASTSASNAG